jgi:RNA polymerase sigma-70 factor, ECF subfamily
MENTTPISTNCDVALLWITHQKELRNYILKRVKDADIANDILQEVLMNVYAFCISKSGVNNVRSWLFQIAHNTLIDFYRKQSKFTADEQFPQKTTEDENLAFKEAADFILPMIEFLPEDYAVPLKLADIDGMKQAEIAQLLNLSLSATKSRIQRARQLLKAEFITCCNFETDKLGTIISFDIKDSCMPLHKYKKENLS